MANLCCCESDRDECGCRWWRLYGVIWWCLFIFAAGALGLTLYGEHHYAGEMLALQPLLHGYVPSPCSPLPVNDRKLVHIDCPLTELDSFLPPSAFSPNIAKFTGVFFETRAEMYQNVQKVGTLGPSIEGAWVDHWIDFSQIPSMVIQGGRNPDFFPVVPGRGRVFSTTLKAGGFGLPAHLLTRFTKKQLLPLVDDGYYQPSDSRPPTHVDYKNTQVRNNALYTGDPDHPQIGDIRVTFWGSTATHVSLIGLQTVGFLGSERYIQEFPSPALQNRTAAIFAEGDYNPEALVAEHVSQTHASNRVTWILRCAAVLLLWFWLFVTVVTCSTTQTCFTIFVNCGLFALSITSGLAGLVWWQFDTVVAISLWVLASGSVVLALITWVWDSNKCANDCVRTGGEGSPYGRPPPFTNAYRGMVRWTTEPAARGSLDRSLIQKNGNSNSTVGTPNGPLQENQPLSNAASFQL
ncbi:hypothetical protein BESB_049020 [Besnoitia besnoiti]|uniref:Transmembrane protein n=1 Tax=Besnoitia besnoiti TaxID=94643 RepID=A0A2A9MMC7_BESBE|nr:hypothetical protein BESB_049020 [Besnoitia besnoiti]PFH36710.1 hypothetical protein BESB_049020 [Besnoitia besnoiti]